MLGCEAQRKVQMVTALAILAADTPMEQSRLPNKKKPEKSLAQSITDKEKAYAMVQARGAADRKAIPDGVAKIFAAKIEWSKSIQTPSFAVPAVKFPQFELSEDAEGLIELLRRVRELENNPAIKASPAALRIVSELVSLMGDCGIPELIADGVGGQKIKSEVEALTKEQQRSRAKKGAQARHRAHALLQTEAREIYAAGTWHSKREAAQPVFAALKKSPTWEKGLLTESSGAETIYRWLLKK